MNYEKIEEIKRGFYLIGALQKKAVFECFTDGIFTYHLYEEDGSFHEINIINKNATFMKEEKVVILLNLKGTFYLSHRFFMKLDKIGKKPFELISSIEFRMIDLKDEKE